MAGKEAVIYILDLGKSMGEKRHGRDQTDLDWALEYVWDKITNTVSRRSYGDLVRMSWSSRSKSCIKKIVITHDTDPVIGCDRPQKRIDERDRLSHRRD
jgi:hypothetical protein